MNFQEFWWESLLETLRLKLPFNPLPSKSRFVEKPGKQSVSPKCVKKYLWKIDIFSKVARDWHIIQELQLQKLLLEGRSSRPEVFCINGVLKNFTKFVGKYLWQSLFSGGFFWKGHSYESVVVSVLEEHQ